MERGDSSVKYKISDFIVLFVTSDVPNDNDIEINSVRLVAVAKNRSVRRPYETIWSESQPVYVVISQSNTRGHIGELEFLMPEEILQRADHVGLVFSNNSEMWPIDVGLIQMYRNVSGIGVICPGAKIGDDADNRSLLS